MYVTKEVDGFYEALSAGATVVVAPTTTLSLLV